MGVQHRSVWLGLKPQENHVFHRNVWLGLIFPLQGGKGTTSNTSYKDVASNLLVIDLRLDVRIACDSLKQKFQHAEYSTCDPLIFQPVLILFSCKFHH